MSTGCVALNPHLCLFKYHIYVDTWSRDRRVLPHINARAVTTLVV